MHNNSHQPRLAYSPLQISTVEVLNRDLLIAMRSTLVGFKLARRDWVCIVEVIPTVINEYLIERLGHIDDGAIRTPFEAMTGI